MRILVTAGNTLAPIDRVRGITNIFTGRTGANLARHAAERGHAVTLLTSQSDATLDCLPYRTFDDLARRMEESLAGQAVDALLHCAAVGDYRVEGVYAGNNPVDVAGKIKSDVPELWLRLVRTPKLVDRVRADWGFRGILVKFKLEADIDDERLLEIAERSRRQSLADWMVANTLEGMNDWAYLGNERGYERLARADLPRRLLDAIEGQHG